MSSSRYFDYSWIFLLGWGEEGRCGRGGKKACFDSRLAFSVISCSSLLKATGISMTGKQTELENKLKKKKPY